jgi:Kef-type K+ transport system membrane component KefB
MARIGQPPVMGEVLAGILLGPTLLGRIAPSVEHYLFPPFVIPLLTAAADIGLVFFLFLVGLELDTRMLKGRIAHAAAISNGSVVLPLGLGILLALPLYELLGTPDTTYAAFALFMGVAMSITAFPVLARILIDRRMLKRPVGAMALSAAAVDDVTAWGLLAIASGVAAGGSATGALPVLGYVFAFCVGMAFLARPLLARVSAAYDEAGRVPAGWVTAIFAGVLVSAYLSMKSGVAAIFGAFVLGLVMPRRADLSHDVSRRIEEFVSVVLLPLFFVVSGLKMDVGLLNRGELWAWTGLIIAVAIVGKFVGAAAIARVAGYDWRESAVLGALMNTRGLTELIVLNIGLELGVISRNLFTMLVLMALVTTFMTAPLLRALDRKGVLSSGVEEELEARPTAGSILVAPLAEENVDELLAVAVPLARAGTSRELVVARLLEPPRVAGPLAGRDRALARAGRDLDRLRPALEAQGVRAHGVAFTSIHPGRDLARLAAEHKVDLVLIDGRRPLLGAGLPGGAVGSALRHVHCDVAVLVDQEHVPVIDRDRPVFVAAGHSSHDRTALEVGRRIAAQVSAPVETVEDPVSAEGGGLFVVGLPAHWRELGLGRRRAGLVRANRVPTLFVRSAK